MSKIVIDYSRAKLRLVNILKKMMGFYSDLNSYLLVGWRWILNKQSDNKITIALRKLAENQATALALNTILFAAIGTIFGGLIEQVLFLAAGLNIIVFCAKILGWDKK